MKEKKAVHVIISGRVQGVFFRMETRRTAQEFGVYGWVRNRPDGTVEAVFEGAADKVNLVIAWCSQGPSMAVVTDVKTDEIDYSGEFSDFSIRH